MTGKPPTLTDDEIKSIRQDIIDAVAQNRDYPTSSKPKPLSIEVVEAAISDLRTASGMLNTFFETATVRGTHHPKASHWYPQAIAFDFSEGFDIYFNEDWVLTQNPAQMRGALYQVFLQVVNGAITKIGDRNKFIWERACNFVMTSALSKLVDKVGGQGFLKVPETEFATDEFNGLNIEQVYDALEDHDSITIDLTEVVFDDEDEDDVAVEDAQVFVTDTAKDAVQGHSKEAAVRVQAIIDKISHGLSPLKNDAAKDVPSGINIALFLISEAGA